MPNGRSKILLVDDEINCLRAVRDVFDLEGFNCLTANSGMAAIELFDRNDIDIVVTDIRMPKMNGIELLKKIKERKPSTRVLMLTGYGSIEDAVESIKLGAYNYILKPVNVADLLADIHDILKEIEGEPDKESSAALIEELPEGKHLLGRSERLNTVTQLIQKIAKTDLSVLIQGESGTGKELAAMAIHYSSDRAKRPFISINCAALPETLLESELFGYEKGAFTDAKTSKKGKVELAHTGTLFLDEIGDMSHAMQAKLLRVLEARELDRLGSDRKRKVDIRLLSATNQDLRSAMEQGHFRNDLYYRLNTVNIVMPALREMREDIPLLANSFIKEYAIRLGRPVPVINDESMDVLLKYNWPGNVRELGNSMRRAVALCDGGVIRNPDLPEHLVQYETSNTHFSESEMNKPLSLAEVEKRHILNVLEGVNGNRSKAANLLGIHRDTLLRKLKQYGLS